MQMLSTARSSLAEPLLQIFVSPPAQRALEVSTIQEFQIWKLKDPGKHPFSIILKTIVKKLKMIT